jgi:hypothetical protein
MYKLNFGSRKGGSNMITTYVIHADEFENCAEGIEFGKFDPSQLTDLIIAIREYGINIWDGEEYVECYKAQGQFEAKDKAFLIIVEE